MLLNAMAPSPAIAMPRGRKGSGGLSGWGADVDIQELKDRMDGWMDGYRGSKGRVRKILYRTVPRTVSPRI